MHRVDRGPEPAGLQQIRFRYTRKWVEHYRDGTGTKPSDSYWGNFYTDLARSFFDLCGYCEEECRGEVDHFRPKSRFPEHVYQWSNWVLACHSCNHRKRDGWPSGGYVDPCAKTVAARPEKFFDFDTTTGLIKPKTGLSQAKRKKAIQMIQDLHLNASYHLKRRLRWLRSVAEALSDESAPSSPDFLAFLTDRSQSLSSIIRVFLAEQGHNIPSD